MARKAILIMAGAKPPKGQERVDLRARGELQITEAQLGRIVSASVKHVQRIAADREAAQKVRPELAHRAVAV